MKGFFLPVWVAICCSIFTHACTEEMEAISQVTKFRVLGVQAEPPEIQPGDGTTLRVLYADPKGGGRRVTILWLTCIGDLKPTDDLSQGCEPIWAPQIGYSTTNGDRYEIRTTYPDLLDDLPDDEESLSVTVIVVMCAGGDIPTFDDFSDGGEISDFDELCENGEGLVALKTLKISRSASPNRNPEIARVLFEGEELVDSVDGEPAEYICTNSYGCREGAGIEAFLTEESYQEYEITTFDKTEFKTENPYISWFVTGGKVSDDRSRAEEAPGPFDVDWRPPRAGGDFLFYAVAHDVRGGLSWKIYHISAQVQTD